MMRGMEYFSYEERERVGVVQLEEKKTPGRPCISLRVPERGLHKSWRGTFYKGM